MPPVDVAFDGADTFAGEEVGHGVPFGGANVLLCVFGLHDMAEGSGVGDKEGVFLEFNKGKVLVHQI
jgi:hypothetical protein